MAKNVSQKQNSQQDSAVALVDKYNGFFNEINSIFYEREWEVNQIKIAILMKEHVLLKGVPGTAKSMLALKILNGIEGANVYKNQFTRMQDDSYVFGPQLLEEFKKGKIVHNVEGTLVTADFGFLDEFFNASEETLVSTLEILNERTFTRPFQKLQCPLITAIMTTNQDRENEKELRAVYDRIIFKSEVRDIVDSSKRVEMYKNFLSGKIENTQPKISFNDVKAVIDLFDNFDVNFSSGLFVVFDKIISDYENQMACRVSPRKRNKLLKLVKAVAFLRGDKTIFLDDLGCLKFGLVEGGDIKGMGYFDSIFVKIKQAFANYEVVQKMEVLLESAKNNPNKTDAYKISLGIVKKCEKFINEVSNDSSVSDIIVPMVESLKSRAEKLYESLKDSISDEDIFK